MAAIIAASLSHLHSKATRWVPGRWNSFQDLLHQEPARFVDVDVLLGRGLEPPREPVSVAKPRERFPKGATGTTKLTLKRQAR